MAELIARGIRFNVTELGAGEPVLVFLHGLVFDNLSSWYLTVASGLCRHARLVLYDLRGHGRSEQPSNGYTVEDFVGDLNAILVKLGLNDQQVILVAHSGSGHIALSYALRHPRRVAGLVLVDAEIGRPGFAIQLEGILRAGREACDRLLEEMLRDWVSRREGPAARDAETFERIVNRTNSRKRTWITDRVRHLIFDTSFAADVSDWRNFCRESLSSITCPVLAIYGEASELLSHAELLAASLPNCQLEHAPLVGHFVVVHAGKYLQDTISRWIDARVTG